MTRQQAEKRGRMGESVAAWWLRLKGWRILDKRVRTPLGEVDLIVRRGRTIAFVEVKTRASIESAELFLDQRALRRVAAASQALIPRYAKADELTRIDAVLWAPWHRPYHLENIWHG